jgi:ammonium transporter, Amt family
MRILVKAALGAGLFGLAASPAHAQLTVAPDSGDTAWVIAAAVIGFGALLAGTAARLGTRATAIFGAVAIVALFWAVLGYSLAFDSGSVLIGGIGHAFLGNLADIRDGTTVPDAAFALLQLAFVTAAAITLIAAVADRARISWALLFAPLWVLFAYVPIAHWVWGGGWLGTLGVLDYAGGLPVHTVTGISALVVAWMIGRRTAPLDAETGVGGTAVLLAGWLALAGGAGLSATADVATAILNTVLAARTAALAWTGFTALRRKPFTPRDAIAGGLSGVAAIAASAGYTGAGGAILLGLIGGAAGYAVSRMVEKRRIDDPLAVFAASGTGGLLGALLLPIAMLPLLGAPVFEDAVPFAEQFVAQAVAVAAVALWSVVATLIAGYTAAMAFPMRDEA